MVKKFTFLFEGHIGVCEVSGPVTYVVWGGCGFDLENAAPKLKAAIEAQRP